jgi:hypothetical protein
LKITSFPHKGNLKLHAIPLHSDAQFTACFPPNHYSLLAFFSLVELSDFSSSEMWEIRTEARVVPAVDEKVNGR